MSASDETNQTQYDFFVSADSGTTVDANGGAPTVHTDLPDYPPGATATITANNFDLGETVEFQVEHVIDPGADGMWGTGDDVLGDNSGEGHEPWSVTDGVQIVEAGADGVTGTSDDVVSGDLDGIANGTIITTWYVNPDDSAGATFRLTADGSTGNSASTSFTDKPQVNLDQWADGPAPDAITAADEWVNGNLGESKAHYFEGQAVPYRAVMTDMTVNAFYTLRINWDTTQGANKHAIDYLTTYNLSFPAGRNETNPNPLIGTTGITAASSTTFGIPVDALVSGAGVTQIPGSFTFWGGVQVLGFVTWGADGTWDNADDRLLLATDGIFGNGNDVIKSKGADGKFGTADDVTIASGQSINASSAYMPSGTFGGSSSQSLAVFFQYVGDSTAGNTVAAAWGGHIAAQADWGTGNSASAISGSSYHMRLLDFKDSTNDSVSSGNQDHSLSTQAVFTPDLTITKTASVPGGTAEAGEVITYTITVDNTGDIGLTNVVVTDKVENGATITLSGPTGDTDNDSVLDITETWTYTATYTVQQSDIDSNGVTGDGDIDNVATVDTTETDPESATAVVPISQNPALNIAKDASVPGGTADAAGEVISYSITVANTGNTTLTGTVVTDPYADAGSIVRGADVVGDNDALLEVGETWSYTAAHTVTQAEIDSNGGGDGLLENTATADSNETGPDTDDASVPVARNPALNITKDASVPGGTADAAGEVISYSITVANTGNTTLTGVVVTDPYADAGSIVRGADAVGDNDALLEVGETWSYTAAHTITQAEIDSDGGGDGLLENTATADSNETGPDTDDASVPVARSASLNITKDASVPGGTADAAGEAISYSITVANTGNTTLTGVVVTDPYADAGSIVRGADVVGDNDALLEVGETWSYTAAHTVTQAEIDSNGDGDGLLENTATADSNETGPDTDDASIPVARSAALNITKDASVPGGTADAAGEVISYSIAVANTGNTTLSGVGVTDPYADAGSIVRGVDIVGDNDALLEVGETWSYTAAHTVTQAEIDSNGDGDGLLENTATADSNETGPDTDDASVPVARTAALNITKDASVPGGTADAAGEVISYSITVANTGNATLTGVVVTDPYADAGSIARGADVVGDDDALLEVGETWSYSAAHTVTQAEIDSNGDGDGLLENTATADSNETGPDTDDASVSVTRTASLNIIKDASVPGGSADAAGEVIAYSITVANTGNATLTGVVVTDPYADAGSIARGGDLVGDNDALLEVGETWSYTAAHTVTQAEIDSNGEGDGFLENTATADSNETGPDTDDASVPVARNASLNITKDASVPGGTADAAGEVISYSITVANTGNTTLTGVVVTDPYADAGSIARGADLVGDNDALLEVGETWSYTAAHTVTQAEIDSNGDGDGLLENAATADSNETGPDTDDASVPVARNASLNITKDASVPGGSADVAGEVISYTIAVANTGNATLTGVVVTDPYADAGSVVRGTDVVGDNDALLEVGETWSYTAAHTVTQAEIDSNGDGDGFLENTATADSNETGPDTDDASVPVARSASLNITKDASVPGGSADAAGEVISYSISVANTGNTTLTGVVVTDPYADAGSIVRGADVVGDNDALLEVGETWSYTAAHTVTQAEIDSNGNGDGFLENTATADSNETGPDTADASVPVTRSASLNITKDASVPGGTADAAGEAISYSISVANTGNATLTGIVVTDPYADAGSIVRGADLVGDDDALLEVGETWSYTAAHTVTQAEIDSNGDGDGLLENTATADSNETGPDTDDASVPVARTASLNIIKDASVPGGTADDAGEVISYSITVANTGNTTLTDIVVTDPYADAGSIVRGADVVGDNDALLEVGETWSYTAAHTVTQAEIDSNGDGDGFLENTATADSNETGPDTDDASVPVSRNPALNITKDASVPGGTADAAGEVISYAIAVANTGNTTLTGVVVTDPYADAGSIVRGADLVGDDDALLEIGETWSYTAAHTVTQAEIDSNGDGDGLLENTATADSNETGPDTDDASVPVSRNPSLNITKDATVPGGTVDAAGEVISYAITVANTGNTTLTGVVVADPYADAGSIVRGADAVGDNDALLELGETWSYTAAHTVAQAEIDSDGGGDGLLENTATADSNETGPDTDDASVVIDRTVDLFGYKFGDLNGNGVWDKAQGEAGLSNWTIELHVDSNHNGTLDATDALVTSTVTTVDGSYLFDDIAVAGHTYFITEVLQDGWTQTAPSGGIFTVQVDSGLQTFGEFDFGNQMAPGPGVRTPGFWSNNGAPFWDAKADNGKHAGDPCFPDHELVYAVDSDGPADGNAIDPITFLANGKPAATVGLLIGDYNTNGTTDAGEDTFFISLSDAQKVINASQKDLQDGRWVLARDAVASWLNYLAGNSIGTVDAGDGAYSPREALNDAIDWLQVTTGGNNATTFGKWPGGGTAVKQSTAAWNTGLETEAARAGVEPGGNSIHEQLDEYNNTGGIDGTFYAFDGDNCGTDQHFVQYATMLKTAEDLHLI